MLYMGWVGWDGMVILDHRYSQSTFGANKKGVLPLISDDNSISMKNLEHTAFHQQYHRWRLTDEIDSLLCQDPGFTVPVLLAKKIPAVISSFCSRAWWRP